MGGAVPRGGGLSGACYVLCMCRPAMQPGRVYLSHSSLAPAWLLSRGSQELGRSTDKLPLADGVNLGYPDSVSFFRPRRDSIKTSHNQINKYHERWPRGTRSSPKGPL
jgi:hypothetical protein